MSNDLVAEEGNSKVDFEISPIAEGPQGDQNFSMAIQRDRFLGGGPSGENLGKNKGFLKPLEFFSRLVIRKPNVEDRSNLPSVPCVIATTHLSDVDIQTIALEAARDRKIGIVSQQTNQEAFKPIINAMGAENFFSITNVLGGGDHATYSLRLEDFKKMQDGITNEGRTMVIAAHKPTHNWELPENSGIGAVILAHLAHVPLVPAALDIQSEAPVKIDPLKNVKNFVTGKRSESKMAFCPPVPLTEISEDKIQQVINLYSPDARRAMSEEEIARANETLEILKKEAGSVMRALASKVDIRKRGKWGESQNWSVAPLADVDNTKTTRT